MIENPIIQKILKEGVNSVNISMLNEESRKRILSDVGERLYRQGRKQERNQVLEKNSHFEMLKAIGDQFMVERKIELAALSYIPTKDKERLNAAAALCLREKKFAIAAKAYEAADNKEMADMI